MGKLIFVFFIDMFMLMFLLGWNTTFYWNLHLETKIIWREAQRKLKRSPREGLVGPKQSWCRPGAPLVWRPAGFSPAKDTWMKNMLITIFTWKVKTFALLDIVLHHGGLSGIELVDDFSNLSSLARVGAGRWVPGGCQGAVQAGGCHRAPCNHVAGA